MAAILGTISDEIYFCQAVSPLIVETLGADYRFPRTRDGAAPPAVADTQGPQWLVESTLRTGKLVHTRCLDGLNCQMAHGNACLETAARTGLDGRTTSDTAPSSTPPRGFAPSRSCPSFSRFATAPISRPGRVSTLKFHRSSDAHFVSLYIACAGSPAMRYTA